VQRRVSAILVRGEHHQEALRREYDGGKAPLLWVLRVVGEVVVGEVVGGAAGVVQLDPVAGLAVFVFQATGVAGDHFGEDGGGLLGGGGVSTSVAGGGVAGASVHLGVTRGSVEGGRCVGGGCVGGRCVGGRCVHGRRITRRCVTGRCIPACCIPGRRIPGRRITARGVGPRIQTCVLAPPIPHPHAALVTADQGENPERQAKGPQSRIPHAVLHRTAL
jgi:hypothetical protein